RGDDVRHQVLRGRFRRPAIRDASRARGADSGEGAVKASLVPIDSAVLGRNVLSIDGPAAGFAAFEAAYVAEHDPFYVSCKVPLDRIVDVHLLEAHGFELIECQIRTRIDLRKPRERQSFPFAFGRVASEEDLAPVLEIAGTTFGHDRFSIDPRIDPS